MGGFPALRRDVLRWLVTLNLSQPIKNVRRDFSNGFLVAEIFSQYYPQDVQMHSFDNGTKLAKKQDNWAQLEKLFRKKDFPLLPGEIENIISCGPEDGIGPLLERMYWFLARKSKPQEQQVLELWTGLPDTHHVTSLTPNVLRDSKLCEDESYFADFHSMMSSSYSQNLPTPVFNASSRLHDAADGSEQKTGRHTPFSDRKQQGYLEQHELTSSGRKKPVLNAVERARQKEMKELSKERSRAAKAAKEKRSKDVSQDPRLAFRSPNRQRHFKSYSLMDYKRQQTLGYVELGKLGPDSTEELRAKRETLEKMKEFGRSARSIVAKQNAEPRKPKAKPLSTRAKALKFASTVPKPKKKDEQKLELQENTRPAPQPLSELEILEAKYQADKRHLEAMRKDLEIFLR